MTIQELQGLAEEYTLAPTPKVLKAIQDGLEVVTMSHHAEEAAWHRIKALITPLPKSRAFPAEIEEEKSEDDGDA